MALMRIYGNRKGARGTFLPTYIFLFQEKRDHIDTIRHFCTIYSVCKGQGSFLHLDTGSIACYIRIPYFNDIRLRVEIISFSNYLQVTFCFKCNSFYKYFSCEVTSCEDLQWIIFVSIQGI